MILQNIVTQRQIDYSHYKDTSLDIGLVKLIIKKDHLNLTVWELEVLAPVFLSQDALYSKSKTFYASMVLHEILYLIEQKDNK